MSEDDLDPRLVSMLGDLPPAPDGVREMHISLALAQIGRPATVNGQRTRILGVAAAVILLLTGVMALRSTGPRRDSGVSAAEHMNTTMPVKSGADSSTTIANLPSRIECASSLQGSQQVGEYVLDESRRVVNLTDSSIEIVDLATCDPVAVVSLPALPRSQTVCIPSLVEGTQFVGTYATGTTNVVVLATDSDLSLLGGPSCQVVARIPQPSGR